MGCFGNLLWMVCGGLLTAFSWCMIGCLWCITIVGIPVGIQCFKFAKLSLIPFGKEVVYDGKTVSVLLTVCWLLLSGGVLAIEYFVLGLVQCVTIIGIPFGLQNFKLAKLALMPFGSKVI